MLTVYGADWCEDTRRARRLLRRLGVPHDYVNIDEDLSGLERAKALNEGRRRTPTIDLDGDVLVEPQNDALTNALIAHGRIDSALVEERLAVQNVGDLERTLRAGGGLLLYVLARRAPSPARAPIRLVAATLALTGFSGWCPVFAAAGLTSLGGPGDRPDEGKGQRWIRTQPSFPPDAAAAPDSSLANTSST
jgi:glutaredoxin